MSERIKTVDDALTEARDADDPCCFECSRRALTLLADEVEQLRAIKVRAQNLSVAEPDHEQPWQRNVRSAARVILGDAPPVAAPDQHRLT